MSGICIKKDPWDAVAFTAPRNERQQIIGAIQKQPYPNNFLPIPTGNSNEHLFVETTHHGQILVVSLNGHEDIYQSSRSCAPVVTDASPNIKPYGQNRRN